jgi:nicotinamide mononucleotide transporter
MLQQALAFAAPWLAPAFTLWGSPITWLELVAVALSIAMVWCNLRVNVTGWPLAIAASALYGVLFASSRLYGEATLQLLFIVVAFWGWWQWLRGHGGDGQPLQVHRMSVRQIGWVAGLTLLAWPLLGLGLHHYTDTDVPYLDALPTAGSVAGQFLLGRKLIENWLVWLAVNVFSVGLFAIKGLWLTTLLYALFAALSVAGWRAWRARLPAAAGGA